MQEEERQGLMAKCATTLLIQRCAVHSLFMLICVRACQLSSRQRELFWPCAHFFTHLPGLTQKICACLETSEVSAWQAICLPDASAFLSYNILAPVAFPHAVRLREAGPCGGGAGHAER